MSPEELIGLKLVFGIPGTRATPEIIQHFKDTRCHGLILYRINFESPDQIRALISDLENALGYRLLVCTDHEGGRVIMFGDGVTVFPSAQAFGRSANTQFARHQGEQEARELRRLGIDVNFAPVLDVLTDVYSPNIGVRSFGSDPDLVAKMGAARISAMQVEGLSACAKHFPGLGPASLDPHLKLPTISTTWPELEAVHLVPFLRAMRTAVHSIMTSHPLYPNLDSTPRTPVTFSRKIVHDYLRMKIGYKGVIFSDDLEMGAITELCPIGEAAVKAVQAGHDMVLACHDRTAQRQTYDALVAAASAGQLNRKELEDSAQRIEILRARRTDRFSGQPGTLARAERERHDVQALVREITSASVTVLRDGPPLLSGTPAMVLFPRISALAPTIMIEKELQDEAAFLRAQLKPLAMDIEPLLYDLDPTAEQIQRATEAAAKAPQTLIVLYDAHIHGAEKELLQAVQAKAKRLVVILLRDAYDIEFVLAGTLCLTNFGPRVCDLTAVFEKLVALAAVPTPQ